MSLLIHYKVGRLFFVCSLKGLIKKAKGAYKYYLTTLGSKIIASALNFKERLIQKQLAYQHSS